MVGFAISQEASWFDDAEGKEARKGDSGGRGEERRIRRVVQRQDFAEVEGRRRGEREG